MGTKADGMWGEATNSFHRVLNATNAPYRNDTSGPSGAHTSYVKGVNTGRPASKTYKTASELYKAVSELKDKYYSNGGDDWFWGDSSDATDWRVFLQKTLQGREILDEFYDDALAQGKKVDYKKLTNTASRHKLIQDINEGKEAAVKGLLTTTAVPMTVLSGPIGWAGIAGGALGSKLGGDLVQNLSNGTKVGTDGTIYANSSGYTIPSFYYGQIPATMPTGDYYEPVGQVVGGALGGALGGIAGSTVSMPTRATLNTQGAYTQRGRAGRPRTYRSQYRNTNGTFANPTESYAIPQETHGTPRISSDNPGLVGSQQLHAGQFAPRTWRPMSDEFNIYLEATGNNPGYTPSWNATFGFKHGGILKRNI